MLGERERDKEHTEQHLINSTSNNMATTPKRHTAKDETWIDANGVAIPYKRTDTVERTRERNAHRLYADASKLAEHIAEFKKLFVKCHSEVVDASDKKNGSDVKKTKGNKDWFSFDRGIKIEADIQERIEFDDLTISAAREKLDAFLKDAVKSEVEFVSELITSAFSTSNGKLDAKKVMGLLGFRHKIKAAMFQEAMELIEKSILRTGSKQYFRISVRQEDGSYEAVNLNFSK